MAECVAIDMAELIELGLEFTAHGSHSFRVEERPNVVLELVDSIHRASPLGLALIGMSADPNIALSRWMHLSNLSRAGKIEAAAHLLGISVAFARLIEVNHANGLSARTIAGNLRTGTLGLALGRKTVPASPFKVRSEPRAPQSGSSRSGASAQAPAVLRMAAASRNP